MRRTAGLSVAVALVSAAVFAPAAEAIHFYRGSGGGCTPADGALDDGADPPGNVAATVAMFHNLFIDSETDGSDTFINAGEAVTWTWDSSHCHSATGIGWDSGFHYPTEPPESMAVAPGVFDYPFLDETPTLSYTRTFTEPGTYSYICVHHSAIGMNGRVIVQ